MVKLDTNTNNSTSNNQSRNTEAIYTTLCNGRIYVASGKNYLGDVNSYDGLFVKFFTWLFRISISVNFDGQNISVNKKSYLKLVKKVTEKDIRIKNIKNYTFFKNVADSRTVEGFGWMRDHISSSESQYLFRKLARAISSNNTNEAFKLIGKGASVDQEYFDRENHGVSFKSDNAGLDKKKYRFKVVKANPFLHAHVKNNTAIAKKLEEYGANTTNEGEEYTFNRVITDVEQTTDLVKETKYKAHFPVRSRNPSARTIRNTLVDRRGHVLPGNGRVLPGRGRVLSGRGRVLSGRGRVPCPVVVPEPPVITKETTLKTVPRTIIHTRDFKTDACMIKLEY